MQRQRASAWRRAGLWSSAAALSGLAGCVVRGSRPPQIHVSMSGNQVQETVQKTFKAEKVAHLRLQNVNGSIEVDPAAPNVDEIHIQATKIVSGSSAQDQLKPLLAKVQVEATLEGDTLKVQSRYPHDLFKQSTGVSVNYVISVPARLIVDLSTSNGTVQVNGVQGGGKVHSDYGNIDVHAVGGTLDISTSSGEITVDDAHTATSLTAKTDYGSIDLQNVSGVIDARSGSGPITVGQAQQTKRLTLHSDYGNIDISDAGGPIDASSSSGQISVAHAHVSDHLALHTDYGNVEATEIHADGTTLKVDLTTNSGTLYFRGDSSDLTLKSDYGAVEAALTSTLTLQSAKLHSSSGNVAFTLPSSVSARIDADTASGHVELPGPSPSDSQNSSHRTLTLGSGAAPVSLHSDYGNVALQTQ